MITPVKIECCKTCPSWWRWYNPQKPEEGGYCKFDESRLNCVWSDDEIEREEEQYV